MLLAIKCNISNSSNILVYIYSYHYRFAIGVHLLTTNFILATLILESES